MKKAIIFISSLFLLAALSACGKSANEEEEKATASGSSKGDTIEVEIEDASYILAGKDDGESIGEEKEGGLMQIDLLIKNVSDSSIDIFPEMQMQLYDEDKQIDPSSQRNASLELGNDSNSSIGADKQKTLSVLFDVEKDKEYEINIAPRSTNPEEDADDVTVPLDTSEYNDSLKDLQSPGKALEAYVETIYFDEDNSDYDEYVSADKGELQDDAVKQFADSLGLGISGDISDSDAEKYYESFKQASAEKDEIEAEVQGYANDKAIVVLNYSALAYGDITDELSKYKDKYRDKHDGFDPDKEDEYALSKFDSVLDKIEAKDGSRELEIAMKKNEDGKWEIDDSEMDMSENISRVFAEGAVM